LLASHRLGLHDAAHDRGDFVTPKSIKQAIVAPDDERDDQERNTPPDLLASFMRGLGIISRWRWRCLATFLGVIIVGFVVLLLATERYTAHASLIVGIRQPEMITAEQSRDLSRTEPDIDGAIELMKSEAVLRQVNTKLAAAGFVETQTTQVAARPSLIRRLRAITAGLLGRKPQHVQVSPDPIDRRIAELRRGYKLDRVGRSTLVDLSFTSTDPVLAAAAANALAAVSTEDESQFSGMSVSEQSGFQLARTSIVSSATIPEDPSSPSSVVILGAAALIGFAATVTVALLSEFRAQQTVLNTEALSRRGIRALGLFPSNPEKAGADRVFQDSITTLQAALSGMPPWRGAGGGVFLFTSALAGDGKSTVSVALAKSMAASGRKVLLVDADLRSPAVARLLGLQAAPGLSTCLRAGEHSGAAVQRDAASGLDVITAGDELARPFDLLAAPCLPHLVDAWRQIYDVVLIDSAPVLAFGDARILTAVADYVVVLARWSKTNWTSLSYTLQMLADNGGRIAGVAISQADLRKLRRFDYVHTSVYGLPYAAGSRPPSS
jgi:capsular exopolysaccharide synthesis family protein